MCHLLQCKLLWDPHGWLSSTSTTNRDRAGPGRQGDRERDRDLTEIWKLFQCLFSASGIFFGNFIEKLFSELKHPIFLLWRCGFLLPPSFICSPQYLELLGPPSQWVSVVGGVDTPVQHPEREAFFFSNYHITAALAGVEKSPLTLTVIILLGELR